ncbi:uncharacterized protein TRUGW13939_05291 [Talaromyces rugulosus]|uniref:Uncharacterized protein n=1 Tax=Talaromyces rugulosus TaxID=121627 RepID=A0A7H8QVW1_TALRU|nr:uncharacterized protein TRUGW13939_05291 [Talaromyces rugulosus]QKX58170.1 hypothetical protein TRUGW13939_05291 [Talaromyces rugulosus]
MAAPTNLSVPVAETRLTSLSVDDELKEYEKILRISEEIFAGTHPRLKVPQQFVRKAPSRTLQTPVASAAIESATTPQPKATPSNASLVKPKSLHGASPAQAGSIAPRPAGAKSHVAPKLAPEIDPIFLTKSDDLVRAEIQLQRRRVENALREQTERTKYETRQKAVSQDEKPDFDISDVLNQALEIVKPLPSVYDALGANGTNAPSDSFDENSLYSSRAPDSPSGGDHEQHAAVQGTTNIIVPSQGSARPAQAEFYEELEETQDEPEYSPPEPTEPMLDVQEDDDYQPPDVPNPRRPIYERPPRYAMRQQSVSPDMRIVRNHITSPAAPQPSRVSPLATAKQPPRLRAAQNDYREEGPTELSSGLSTPDGAIQQLMPRKRRRVQEPRAGSTVHAINSPGPRIKPEPVSPPPFHETQLSRGHVREAPVYIDIASPQYTPSSERREAIPRESVYEHDRYGSSGRDYEPPAEPSTRATSRLSGRRPMRDTEDLRRVASLHYARNREPVYREYGEPVTRPRSVRASSYAVVERPQHEKATYYEPLVPAYSRHYSQYEDYPPPSRVREFYVEEEPRYIEPQPRRIVVDEYGNQYYEMTPASKIRAMPPPPTRSARPDEYNERVQMRSASVRAGSIVDDGYGSRRYIQEMAPPPSTSYRRVAEHPRIVSEGQRPYSRSVTEHEPVYRSGSVAVEYTPSSRPSIYIDDDASRQRSIRTSSVRPPSSRYEEAREVIHRMPSVRPNGREVSAYTGEESRLLPEYGERPVYSSVRPEHEGRYYTEEDGARMAVDSAGDMVHRIPRYQ